MPNRTECLLIILLIIFFGRVLLYLSPAPLLIDEDNHLVQILNFIEKKGNVSDEISMLPGYHFIIASSLKVSGLQSKNAARVVSTFYSLLTIILFYILAKQFNSSRTAAKTLQCLFCPIVFPFLFLIYTDILSVFWVLLSLYFVRAGKYKLSGLAILAAIFIRQNNIIYSMFLVGFVYLERFGPAFKWKNIKEVFKLTRTHFVVYGLFIIFVVLNKGFSTGQKEFHPMLSIHADNIFFVLILFFFLFLPYHVQELKKSIAQLADQRTLIALSFLFIFYMFAFQASHPWNQAHLTFNPADPALLQRLYPLLRNNMLAFIHSSILLKALFFIPVAFSILFLERNGRALVPHRLLYFFTLVYLVPMWLIEPRYYIIPVVLFILFKKENSRFVESVQVLYFVIITLILMRGIRNAIFFI